MFVFFSLHIRLRALPASTMNFVEELLFLRLEELLNATALSLCELLGSAIPMAQTTLLVLPCGGPHGVGLTTSRHERVAVHSCLLKAQGSRCARVDRDAFWFPSLQKGVGLRRNAATFLPPLPFFLQDMKLACSRCRLCWSP